MKILTPSLTKNESIISKKGLIISMGSKASYSIVQSSRALHIFEEMKVHLPDTYLMLQKNEVNEVSLDNLVQIKPKIAIDGKLILLKGILFRLQMSLQVFHFLLSKKIDYVILRGYDTVILYPFLKIFNIKIYYDFHGRYDLELYQQKRFLRAFLVKLISNVILKYSNKIIVVSNGIISQIEEYSHKCIYLPNGVDIDKIESIDLECSVNIPENKKVIGFIGNWEEFMNVEDICKSAKFLPNCLFIIIGYGYNAFELIETYKNNKNIVFTGRLPQKEAYALLKKFDVCVIPYDKEDLHSQYPDYFSARKTKEYIAAGKPIIIANVVGRESWLIPNENCLLYESRNPHDLAKKINVLLDDVELYSNMSEKNKKLSKQYEWEYIVKNSGIVNDIISCNK